MEEMSSGEEKRKTKVPVPVASGAAAGRAWEESCSCWAALSWEPPEARTSHLPQAPQLPAPGGTLSPHPQRLASRLGGNRCTCWLLQITGGPGSLRDSVSAHPALSVSAATPALFVQILTGLDGKVSRPAVGEPGSQGQRRPRHVGSPPENSQESSHRQPHHAHVAGSSSSFKLVKKVIISPLSPSLLLRNTLPQTQ